MGQEAFRASEVKALCFDVFGTATNWRMSVVKELEEQAYHTLQDPGASHIPDAVKRRAFRMTREHWGEFAQDWRSSYYNFTANVATSTSTPYNMDRHFLESLKELLREWKLEGFWDESTVHNLSTAWRRLHPWPDVIQGIHTLNKKFATCTLSNGTVSLLQDMAKFSNLDWTHIFSSENFGAYKPSPKVYLGAAHKLGLEPGQCALVAAHLGDLKAAKDCGFKTVYIERPFEEQWNAEKVAAAKSDGWVDIWIGRNEDGFVSAAELAGIDSQVA